MTLIKKNSQQLQMRANKVTPNPGVASPKKVAGEPPEVVTPQETFKPSTLDRAPVTSAPEKTVKSEVANPEAKKVALKTPRSGSDMALMLENMEAAKTGKQTLQVGSNGTLMLVDSFAPESATGGGLEKSLQQALQKAETTASGKVHENSHEHGHGHSGDALLGGHLGTEIVEKIGHNAHHAVEHGASHAVTQVKSQAGHSVGQAVTEAKAQGAHGVTHAATEVKSQAAHGVTHAVTKAKNQAAHGASQSAASAKAEAADALAETATDAVDVGHHLSTGLTTALGASAAISGGLGAVMLVKGFKEGKEGIKEGNVEKMAEGVGGLAVGTRSVAASAVMASMVSSSGTLAEVAAVASKTLTPLGVVHGAVDVGLGVKDLIDKKPVDGLLKIGLGASIAAGAVVGGLPLTVLAVGFLGAKVGRAVYKGNQAKKAAVAEQQQQAPKLPDPAVYSDPYAALKDTST